MVTYNQRTIRPIAAPGIKTQADVDKEKAIAAARELAKQKMHEQATGAGAASPYALPPNLPPFPDPVRKTPTLTPPPAPPAPVAAFPKPQPTVTPPGQPITDHPSDPIKYAGKINPVQAVKDAANRNTAVSAGDAPTAIKQQEIADAEAQKAAAIEQARALARQQMEEKAAANAAKAEADRVAALSPEARRQELIDKATNDLLSGAKADRSTARAATEAQLNESNAKAILAQRARSGVGGMGLTGAAGNLEGSTRRSGDQNKALTLDAFDRTGRAEEVGMIQAGIGAANSSSANAREDERLGFEREAFKRAQDLLDQDKKAEAEDNSGKNIEVSDSRYGSDALKGSKVIDGYHWNIYVRADGRLYRVRGKKIDSSTPAEQQANLETLRNSGLPGFGE
jgi:hypothetical protein